MLNITSNAIQSISNTDKGLVVDNARTMMKLNGLEIFLIDLKKDFEDKTVMLINKINENKKRRASEQNNPTRRKKNEKEGSDSEDENPDETKRGLNKSIKKKKILSKS
jgi:hypothetical protein